MQPEPPAFSSPPLSLVAAGFALTGVPLSVFLLVASPLDAESALAMILFPARSRRGVENPEALRPFPRLGWLIAISAGALAAALVIRRSDEPLAEYDGALR